MDSDADSDTEEFAYYDDWVGDEAGDIHPILTKDLNHVMSLYGETALSHRHYETLDVMEVSLKLSLAQFDARSLVVWGLEPAEPLVLHLQMSSSLYRDGNRPQLSVYQTPADGQQIQRRANQLLKILEAFVYLYWSQKSEAKSCDVDIYAEDDLSSLLDMGFPLDDAKMALQKSANKQQAVDMLLTGRVSVVHDTMKNSCSFPPPHARAGAGILPKSLTMCDVTSPVCESDQSLTLIPSSTMKGLSAKTIPPMTHGFLVQCMDYMQQRIATLNEYCVVCDEAHVFQNGAMLKPAVCSRELCVFAFSTLGVMSDAADDIASGAEVVDLLVHLLRQASSSSRKALVLDPFPTVVDPTNKASLALSRNKKDFDRVDKCLASMPNMEKLSSLSSRDLKDKLDMLDQLCYPLLQWIISSNRSHIVRLPPDKQLKVMHTSHQFLLLCSSPAKEAKFRVAKAEFGSSFAMHGSMIENWHSILRNGLIVGTGTRHQMNGAAYGSGIYLSPSAPVSYTYSGMGHGSKTHVRPAPVKPAPLKLGHLVKMTDSNQQPMTTCNQPRFLTSKNLACVAMCEVVEDQKTLKKHGGNVWVCSDPDHVCTRFLFVYEDGQVGGLFDTTYPETKAQIQQALSISEHSGSS